MTARSFGTTNPTLRHRLFRSSSPRELKQSAEKPVAWVLRVAPNCTTGGQLTASVSNAWVVDDALALVEGLFKSQGLRTLRTWRPDSGSVLTCSLTWKSPLAVTPPRRRRRWRLRRRRTPKREWELKIPHAAAAGKSAEGRFLQAIVRLLLVSRVVRVRAGVGWRVEALAEAAVIPAG